MNSLHIFVAAAMAPVAAELSMSAPPMLALLADERGVSSQRLHLSTTEAVNVVLMVVLPLALLVILYIFAEIFFGPTCLRTCFVLAPPIADDDGRSRLEPRKDTQAPQIVDDNRRSRLEARKEAQVFDTPIRQTGTPRQPASASAYSFCVRAKEGAILQLDSPLVPHPQETSVAFRSLKSTSAVRGRADELQGQSKVFVELDTGAPVPLAVLDTSAAIYQAGHAPPLDRKVLLHRAVDTRVGEIAVVRRSSARQFVVLKADSQDCLLTVHTNADGQIERMEDEGGQIVLRSQENVPLGFWVVCGADMALITSIILAVQKLA
jgi:hypothetical protein